MIIPVKLKKENQYQTILSLLSPVTNLSDQESNVLAFFTKKYHDLSQVPEPYRTNAVFSTDVRKECLRDLNMKPSQLNFILSCLKKKKMLTSKDGNTFLNSMLLKLKPDTNKVTYDFIYV